MPIDLAPMRRNGGRSQVEQAILRRFLEPSA
jgi:hypothetical protein